MPKITRVYLKTSLIFLAAGFLLGMLRALPVASLEVALRGSAAVYYHLLAVGWITQLIFGVAQWMFPRTSHEHRQGSHVLAWMTYALLNVGLLLRAIAEPRVLSGPGGEWGPVLGISALIQWTAGMLFIVDIWPRVRGR